MTDDMDQPVTKRDLAQRWRDVDELKRDVVELKRDVAELRLAVAERPTFGQVRTLFEEFERRMRVHMLALFEDFEGRVRAMFDPYRDLPPRTARLELAVFGPDGSTSRATRKRPATKRRKRAA